MKSIIPWEMTFTTKIKIHTFTVPAVCHEIPSVRTLATCLHLANIWTFVWTKLLPIKVRFRRSARSEVKVNGPRNHGKSCLARPINIIFIIFFLNHSTCVSRPVPLLSFRGPKNPIYIIWWPRCDPFHFRWSWKWVYIRHSNESWPRSIFTWTRDSRTTSSHWLEILCAD